MAVNSNSLKNLKLWKPGQSGNMSGRGGVLPPEVREKRKKNQSELIKLVDKMMRMTSEQAEVKFKAAETTQLEHAVQALIGKAISGEVIAFRYLMEVISGKIPEHDYDGFTEEDLRILNRVKEIFSEQKGNKKPKTINVVGEGDTNGSH